MNPRQLEHTARGLNFGHKSVLYSSANLTVPRQNRDGKMAVAISHIPPLYHAIGPGAPVHDEAASAGNVVTKAKAG